MNELKIKHLVGFKETIPISPDFKGSCDSVDIYKKLNRIGEGELSVQLRPRDLRNCL